MRFLVTVFLSATLFACQNQSSGNSSSAPGDQPALSDKELDEIFGEDPSKSSGSAIVFTDTILVSIAARDFAAVLKEKVNMPILDLRPATEFKRIGHIWRAVNMDPTDKDFESNLQKLSRTQEYAVYCTFGNTSFQVAEEMKRLGFKRIYHLQKGLSTWGETGEALQLK